MEFENRYDLTDEMIKEYVSRVLCKKTCIAGLLISLAALALCRYSYYEGSSIGAGLYGGVFLIAFLASLLYEPLTYRQMKKAELQLHNGKKCETIVSFADKVRMTEGAISMEFEYAQIAELYLLPRVIVLVLGKNQAILLKPDGFTKGSMEAFLPFIRERCKL